jgi:signal transduction histidine kinase
MTALAVALVVVWATAVTTVAVLDSLASAALTGALLLVIGLLSGGVARRAGHGRPSGGVDRQIMVGVGLPVVQMAVAAALFAGVMFVSTHDAILIVLVALFAGTLGLLTARMVTRRLVTDVQSVRDGLVEVGAGRRDQRIEATSSVELVELAEAANTMTDRLEAAERGRRNLIAAISHDLRTPLTSMRLITEALDDEILAEAERRQYLDRLRLNIAALHGLIEDLFELSRLEAGETTWSTEPVDLAMLVGDTVDAMRADGLAKGVTVEADVPDDLTAVRANPEKLQRVLFNLLQNAIRHSPAGSTVTVTASPAEEHVEIEVADEGPGIPDADRSAVFDAFVQAGDRAARGRDGAGLGLAIARAIVEAHDGRIELVDVERGTCVRFSLPASRS